MAVTERLLVLNAGSSSLKASLYLLHGPNPTVPKKPIWEAHQDGNVLKVKAPRGREVALQLAAAEIDAPTLLAQLWQGEARVLSAPHEVTAVGHRVVHGGQAYTQPTFLTQRVRDVIDELSVLAPVHNPPAVKVIDASRTLFPRAPQYAVFDTAFHGTIPAKYAAYAGPYRWFEQGFRRYGFHGINHAYCTQRAAELLNKPVEDSHLIVCHLGNGCSITAVEHGKSVNTTMGFTPLEGLMMGTRSGSVDPGLLLHFIRNHTYAPEELGGVLNKQSGLKGISGISSDMRAVIAAADRGDTRAALAVAMFVSRVCEHVAAMRTALPRLDALVFTAGIGEHAARVRKEVCAALDFMGVALATELNENCTPDSDIAARQASVRVLVIQADENWAIAHTYLAMRVT